MASDDARGAAPIPRAVFFDMDDTLFDHSLTCRDALERLRRTATVLAGRPLDEVWGEYSRLLEAIHPDVVAGRMSVETARRRRFEELARFCGGEVPPGEAERWSTEYRASYQKFRRPVPGARRVLERLHGRSRIVVVSNNQVEEQEEKLAFLGLRRLVDLLVVSEEVGVGKPDPRIFEVALRRAEVSAAETVMVGDSFPNDVLGARGVGIGAVWFNRFRRPAPADLSVPELHSFRAPRRVEALLARAASLSRGA